MAKTLQQLVDRARIPLNDAGKVRYPDADLLAYGNQAVLELRRLRPDLFFGQYLLLPGDKVLTDVLPIPDEWFVPLSDYITARAEGRDDEDAMQQRSAQFFALWQGGL